MSRLSFCYAPPTLTVPATSSSGFQINGPQIKLSTLNSVCDFIHTVLGLAVDAVGATGENPVYLASARHAVFLPNVTPKGAVLPGFGIPLPIDTPEVQSPSIVTFNDAGVAGNTPSPGIEGYTHPVAFRRQDFRGDDFQATGGPIFSAQPNIDNCDLLMAIQFELINVGAATTLNVAATWIIDVLDLDAIASAADAAERRI
jgi:hypothetical protein